MKLLLLDADVIIGLLEAGLWEKVLGAYDVHIPATVITEVAFYFSPSGEKIRVDLPSDYAGKFKMASIDAITISQLTSRISKYCEIELHSGELEALAILEKDKRSTKLCTCDKSAIIAAKLLELDDRVISFEKLLVSIGYSKKTLKLKPSQKEDTFKKHLHQGSIIKVQHFKA